MHLSFSVLLHINSHNYETFTVRGGRTSNKEMYMYSEPRPVKALAYRLHVH